MKESVSVWSLSPEVTLKSDSTILERKETSVYVILGMLYFKRKKERRKEKNDHE